MPARCYREMPSVARSDGTVPSCEHAHILDDAPAQYVLCEPTSFNVRKLVAVSSRCFSFRLPQRYMRGQILWQCPKNRVVHQAGR
jgi:hypothetical protein